VQRPVFFARGIIITAYLPIFTLQAVEGRLFKPMAWTVCFALLGALGFAIVRGAGAWPAWSSARAPRSGRTPSCDGSRSTIASRGRAAIEHRRTTLGIATALFAIAVYLTVGGPIGSEFLPHLDEGSIWVRGTLPPSEGPTASIDFTNKARVVMASFPEVTQVVSQTGRPDDGTDTTGFFNTEYFVDLKPKKEWRPVFHQNKEALIAAMDKELSKFPGVIWNYSQPISDNMEEAVSGVKGELAVKLYGDDLRTLEKKADEIQAQMASVKGIEDLGIFRIIGQPNLNYTVDRAAAARWGINVADIQDAVQTAVGANALTQVQQGEARFDVTLRYQQQYRDTREAIENVRLLAPSGERVSLAQLTKISTDDGAEEIYREGGQRYIAIKYSVRGRDLGSTVEEAIAQGRTKREAARRLPPGVGRRIREPEARRQAHGHHRSHHRDGHLPHPLHHVPLLQVGHAHSGLGHHGLHRRTAGAVHHPHQLLGLLGGRLPGALRRLGADRRHHDRVHQPAARPPQGHGSLHPGAHRRSRRRGRCPAPAAHHDDHAGGHAGPAARRALARHRLRLAAPLRHRHRRRPARQPGHRRLPAAHPLRVDGPRRRHLALS
jgi:multidrug efflux pump subunit AcrB